MDRTAAGASVPGASEKGAKAPVEACSLATVMIDAHHSAYVESGAITADPTLLPDYDGDAPEPGTLLVVGDRDGWATLHRVLGRLEGKIEFGPRIPWPDGATAARRLT